MRLEAALRAALASRGLPRGIYVDNGSAFVSAQLPAPAPAWASAWCTPAPAGPRRAGARSSASSAPCGASSWSRSRPGGWPTWSSSTGCSRPGWRPSITAGSTPRRGRARWQRLASAPVPVLPSTEALHEAFLWSEKRAVTKVATISLHGNVFEVDAALVGCRVEVVFDPFDLESVEIRYQGRAMGQGVAVRISRHSHPQGPARGANTGADGHRHRLPRPGRPPPRGGAGPGHQLLGSSRTLVIGRPEWSSPSSSAMPAEPASAGGWPEQNNSTRAR